MNIQLFKIEEIFSFQKKSSLKAGDGKSFGKYPFYTSSSDLNKYVDIYQVEKESMIFGTGGMASIHYCNGYFSTSTDCFVLSPKDPQKVFTKFIYYYLSGHIHLLELGFRGAGLKHISKEYLSNLKVPLIDYSNQQRIATILDHADAIRRKNKEILEKYNQLAQSVFLEMFGDLSTNSLKWKEDLLHNLCTDIIDCPHSTPIHSETKTIYPCIRTSEIKNGSIDWSTMKYLTHDNYIIRTKRLIPIPGDIVYGREGSFGDAAIIPEDINMALGQRVMLFRLKKDVVNEVFFWAQIRSPFVYRQALKSTAGSTVGHVNIKHIRNFNFLIPPIDLQNRFTEIIKTVETQKMLVQKSLDNSEKLFQSLLQRAFKGEL